jgi:shikimate 5-dehydrogenase
LVAITKSGVLLPLIVMLGAGGRTVAVWVASDKREQEEIHLVQTVKALEERVMSLETIYTSLPDIAKPLPLSDAKEVN